MGTYRTPREVRKWRLSMRDDATRNLPRSTGRAYAVLGASVAMQGCLGATYAWSVFVGVLKTATPLSQRELQTPFTVFYIVFPLTTIFAGRLIERWGPRTCALLGGLIFGVGWMVAGLGSHHFLLTVLGVGVLGGLGVGCAYLAPISVGMRWFPHRRGLVTGVAVAGFGGGAALIARTAAYWMGPHGVSPFGTMLTLGAVFLCITLPSAGMLTYPPGERFASLQAPYPTKFACQRAFQLLYVAMLAGLAAGFTVNATLAQLSPTAVGRADLGASAVAAFAIANAGGRILWGYAADRISPAALIRVNLLLQAALLGVHAWLLESAAGLLVLAAVAGFNYGGVLVLYAAMVGRQWGPQHVGRVYGALFSANCLAAVAPWLAGLIFDLTGQFSAALYGLAGVLVLAAVAAGGIGSPPRSSPKLNGPNCHTLQRQEP